MKIEKFLFFLFLLILMIVVAFFVCDPPLLDSCRIRIIGGILMLPGTIATTPVRVPEIFLHYVAMCHNHFASVQHYE